MTPRPARVVDAHVHLWDPARTDWYPYLSGRQQLDLGDVSGMARRFDVPTYRSEAAGWNVEKVVNVAAATGPHSVEETLELDRRPDDDGLLGAIVGGIIPTEAPADAVALLDRQMAADRFRGVRPMGAFTGPLPPTYVLEALRERGCCSSSWRTPTSCRPRRRASARSRAWWWWSSTPGGPARTPTRSGRCGGRDGRPRRPRPTTSCASCPGWPCRWARWIPPAFAPWIEHAIETFGPDRCMFASNFPVDGLHGTFDELYSAYAAVVAGLDDATQDALFAGTATRVYRC
jgi:L-fuconolactonase